MRETLTRIGRHRKGAAVLDALLTEREDGSGLSRSDGELASGTCSRSRAAPPERNQRLHDYEVDFFWRELRVIVEVDSYRYHLRKASFDSDRAQTPPSRPAATPCCGSRPADRQEPFAVIARIAAVLTWASARASVNGLYGWRRLARVGSAPSTFQSDPGRAGSSSTITSPTALSSSPKVRPTFSP